MFKKIILAALVVTSAVFAQSKSPIDVKVGARAAFNYGTAWGENSDTFGLEWGPGFTGGVDAKFAVSPNLSIVAGLEFDYRMLDWNFGKLASAYENELSSSGMSSSQRELISEVKFSFGMGYLNIPVLARYNPVPQFFIDAGGFVGFNVSSSIEVSYKGLSRSMDTPKQMQEDIDYGIVAGLGYSIMPKFDVFFRYTMGFAKMVDVTKIASLSGEDVDYSDAPNVGCKNMRFQIGATLWFN